MLPTRLASSCALLTCLAILSAPARAQSTEICNVDSVTGLPSAIGAGEPMISASGRYVVFSTFAALLAADTNAGQDVYRFDVQTHAVELVSRTHTGAVSAAGGAFYAAVSADGRYVAFVSWQVDLVPNDTNNLADCFVRDIAGGTTERVSVSSAGAEFGYLALYGRPRVSASGDVVAFTMYAAGVLPGMPADYHTWARVRSTGQMLLVHSDAAWASVPSGGSGAMLQDLSPDGRFALFQSNAAFFGGPAGIPNLYRKDLATGAVVAVSTSPSGTFAPYPIYAGAASLSADGRFAAFEHSGLYIAPPGVNPTGVGAIWIKDITTGGLELASQGLGGAYPDASSYAPSITADARHVAFQSYAANLAAGDANSQADIFVRDVSAAVTTRESLNTLGGDPNGLSEWPSIAVGGRRLAFASAASNLAGNDANGVTVDVFLRDRGPGGATLPETYCVAKVNALGCTPAVSFTGLPSYSGISPFVISVANLRNLVNGVFFYGTAGPTFRPFQGGWMCVNTPLVRAGIQNTGGSASGADCSGTMAIDFGAYLVNHVNPALLPGVEVCAQFYSRDNGYPPPNNSNLTDAIRFVIGL